jgi:hypothetical protein
MAEQLVAEGGCLCGSVRYRIIGPIAPGAHCHCSMCRRSTGGMVVTWVTVPLAAFTITAGAPRRFRSSPGAERSFCGQCGAQLTFRTEAAPTLIDITVATLDDPASHPPDRHIFSLDRVPWLHLDPALTDYPEDTPATHLPG